MDLEESEKKRQRRRINEEIQRQAIELYRDPVQKLSMKGVAKQLGISHTAVWRILIRNDETRRSVGAPEKYPKSGFSGDSTEQARILGFLEDCSARFHGKQISVETSTTHPAEMKFFNDTFGRYGHANITPDYNPEFSYYQWKLQVLLDRPSFEFLVEYKKERTRLLAEISRTGNVYEYIAGFSAAESWVGIGAHSGHPRASLQITNNDRQPLEWMQKILGGNIAREKDIHKLVLYGKKSVEALRRLPIAHEEKAAAKELILHHVDNGGIGLEALRAYEELRRRIDKEVRLCKLEARLEWIRRHGRPHPKDQDQTIP